MSSWIYLDNQATTRVDPRVVQAMLPTFESDYGNAGSVTHAAGMTAHDLVEQSADTIAQSIGCVGEELVFTSGATESNNLAIAGICRKHTKPGRRRLITAATEHKAVLDPIHRQRRHDFEIVSLPVGQADSDRPGMIDLEQLRDALVEETLLVSVMFGNNEIGTIEEIRAIADLCHEHGALLHTDATQAVGKMPLDVDDLAVDLLSFSAHKFYGPKGVGGLFVRSRGRRIRMESLIAGGGQQRNLRSGTLNVSGIVGMAKALELCSEDLAGFAITDLHPQNSGDQSIADLPTPPRIATLRNLLYETLVDGLGELPLNGMPLDDASRRLYFNLNCQFSGMSASTLMAMADSVAMSSGSACTTEIPEPSHVLKAIGLSDDQVHGSLRFGIGRFNTRSDILNAADRIIAAVKQLRDFA